MAQTIIINKLQTEGENKIANYLSENLPDDYFIYLQPNLQGNRPDIVVFHSLKGIFIIEVKDWKLERYYKVGQKIFMRGHYKPQEIVFPDEQLSRYINIFKNHIKTPITGILIFPNASSKAIRNFIDSSFYPIGFDNQSYLVDLIHKTQTRIHQESLAKTIQNFINPPRHESSSGEIIHFTQQQRKIIEHKESSWKRVRGVAGSGKTLLISQKAARIASENKKVLIITFNKTLTTYIKDNIQKARISFDWNNIEIIHFHGFAKAVLQENNVPNTQKVIDKVIELKENTKNRFYDAILIDEAQDIEKAWFDVLLRYLKSNGEVLLVADDKQNIYDRKLSWISQSMSGFGYKFKGAWGRLSKNMRNRHYPEILTEANRFARQFLQKYIQNNPDKSFGDFFLDNSTKQQSINYAEMHWKNLSINEQKESILLNKILKAYYYLNLKKNYNNADIAILVTKTRLLKAAVQYFQKANIDCIHTLEDKEKFSLQDTRLKLTTVHSFKGMDIKAIIFVNDAEYEFQNIVETYVAITRATDAIIVFNQMKELDEYGEEWG